MPEKSIADLLRESVETATDPTPLRVTVPVFDPPITLHLVRTKDAREREAAMAGLDSIRDETDRALEAVARLLVLSCQKVTVDIADQEHELPKLGLALFSYIYPDRPTPPSDVAAVFGLYTDAKGETDTVAIVEAALEYREWSTTARAEAHKVVLGESTPE